MAAFAKNGELTGRQKAAVFLISVGSELSSRILKHLPDQDVELLTEEIISARKVPPEAYRKVLAEAYETIMGDKYVRNGGIDYARALLEKSLGAEKAEQILSRLTSGPHRRPFKSLKEIDAAQLAGFLQNELPQTIAVVMAHLSPEQAAIVLSSLTPDRQTEVAMRVATMDKTSQALLYEVERVLELKLSAVSRQEQMQVGGIPWVVDVLNRIERSTERSIMEGLSARDQELAMEIKKRMFLFEDIVKLDDRAVQRILADVDMGKDLPMALKGSSDDVKNKVFQNISNRNVDAIKEGLAYLGPVRIRDVEEAQTRIVAIVRSLEERGEIVIQREGSSDELIG